VVVAGAAFACSITGCESCPSPKQATTGAAPTKPMSSHSGAHPRPVSGMQLGTLSSLSNCQHLRVGLPIHWLFNACLPCGQSTRSSHANEWRGSGIGLVVVVLWCPMIRQPACDHHTRMVGRAMHRWAGPCTSSSWCPVPAQWCKLASASRVVRLKSVPRLLEHAQRTTLHEAAVQRRICTATSCRHPACQQRPAVHMYPGGHLPSPSCHHLFAPHQTKHCQARARARQGCQSVGCYLGAQVHLTCAHRSCSLHCTARRCAGIVKEAPLHLHPPRW
jgi:hypothetical protein